ncbi:MAG: DUF4189 domain-containing protein [Pararhodobacter sp.]|nr:DUF4189 domain-containing protein [Pararhodobacter sp.]
MALAALIAVPSLASANAWGAIAFSRSTGAHGYSHNYGSRGAAESRALSGCRRYGPGCQVVVYFFNSCGALAVGQGNGYGVAWSGNRGDAQTRAVRACNSYTSRCRVQRTVCSR